MVNQKAPDKEYTLEQDAFYQIAKRIGMDVSVYDSSTENISKKIAHDLIEKVKHSTDEENEAYKDILSKNKRLSKKFENILNKINTGREEMTDINYKEEFEKKDIYKIAEALKIDLSGYTVDSEDALNKALSDLRTSVKKKQTENSEAENKEAMDKLDSPELKAEFKKLQEEDKRDTMSVETKGTDTPTPPVLSWVEEKKKFWAEYAATIPLTTDFTNPEGDTSPFYCKLSKDENVAGVVSYSAPNAVQITPDSDLKIYQGLVKDAVQNNLSITFGDTLSDTSRLMLYAAVLSSSEKYKNGDDIQTINRPLLNEDLLKSEAFAKLNPEAKQIIQDAYDRRQKEIDDHAKKLQEKMKLLRENLSPEQKVAREAKETDREKIMAARLGIAPYTTSYRAGPKKGEERKVEKDSSLIDDKGNLNEKRITKEMYKHLKKTYG